MEDNLIVGNLYKVYTISSLKKKFRRYVYINRIPILLEFDDIVMLVSTITELTYESKPAYYTILYKGKIGYISTQTIFEEVK